MGNIGSWGGGLDCMICYFGELRDWEGWFGWNDRIVYCVYMDVKDKDLSMVLMEFCRAFPLQPLLYRPVYPPVLAPNAGTATISPNYIFVSEVRGDLNDTVR
jgi:hypothetical protein